MLSCACLIDASTIASDCALDIYVHLTGENEPIRAFVRRMKANPQFSEVKDNTAYDWLKQLVARVHNVN
jgi:hypothetical protein